MCVDAVPTPARPGAGAPRPVPRPRAWVRSWGAVLVLLAALAVASAAPSPVAAFGPGPWSAPVPGPVVRGFRAPACTYCPGHRGADLRAPVGAVVRAVGGGTVVWAGRIAGAGHVVVAHGGGLRTSLSFLRTVTVRAGQRLEVGDPLGTAGAIGPGHEVPVVHLGLRVGERYIDPMLLFRAPDLARAVRLVAS